MPLLNPYAVGTELAYAEITADVNITATVEASAATLITAPSITLNGLTRVCIEVFTSRLGFGGDGSTILNLWQDSTDLGRLALVSCVSTSGTASGNGEVLARRFLTPSAGAKVYTVRGWRVTADGFITAAAPALPSYIRITVA